MKSLRYPATIQPLPVIAMSPEITGQEQFRAYSTHIQERFDSGILAELQPLHQWVVWRAEVEDAKNKKVPYNPCYRNVTKKW